MELGGAGVNELLVDALDNKYGWLVSTTWDRLHYVPCVTFETWDGWWDSPNVPSWFASTVTAVCGQTFRADLPGMFSRMGCKRCWHCCRALGLPQGKGAPVNDDSLGRFRAEVRRAS